MAFEIVSERPIEDVNAVKNAISAKALEFLGTLGTAEAGLIFLNDKYSKETQRGLIRVDHKCLDKARATLALIDQIGSQNVIVRSRGASGMIKKAHAKYMAS